MLCLILLVFITILNFCASFLNTTIQNLGLCSLAKHIIIPNTFTACSNNCDAVTSNWKCVDSTPLESVCAWTGVTCDSSTKNEVVLGIHLVNSLKAIPPEIGLLTSLQEVNVEGLMSGSIPTEIGLLTNLTRLSLTQSNINGTIPTQIGMLTRLTSMGVDHNFLTGSLPTEIGNLHLLSCMNINNNQLMSIFPSELGSLKELRFFRGSVNLGPSQIPTEVGLLTSLKVLDLYRSHCNGKRWNCIYILYLNIIL
jgi:hypothetical protein